MDIYQYVDNFKKIASVHTELLQGDSILKEPFISIIIPVYKRTQCLHEAIDSVLHQANPPCEYEIIVLCDDPDGRLDLIKNYQTIRNIYFYRNVQNIGLFNNSNRGVELARGKYVAFLHDDDIVYPDYVSEIYRFIKRLNMVKCVIPNHDVIGLPNVDNHGRKTIRHAIKKLLFRKPFVKISLKDGLTYLLSNVYKAPSCGVVFEKEAYIKSGGFNQEYWPVGDYYFFLNFNKLFDIYMLKNKLSAYRWIDNLSQQKSIQITGLALLDHFFKMKQPSESVNRYYRFFHNEVVYAKYLMINDQYRDEVKELYPEIKNCKKYKWSLFKLYNQAYRLLRDIV